MGESEVPGPFNPTKMEKAKKKSSTSAEVPLPPKGASKRKRSLFLNLVGVLRRKRKRAIVLEICLALIFLRLKPNIE